MNPHPLEALLRPPVEGYVAVSAVILAYVAYHMPWQPDQVIALDVGLLLGIAVIEGIKARRLLRYQKGLRYQPPYRMVETDIPYQEDRRLLGRGFSWTAAHSQRLDDVLSVDGLKYITPKWWEPALSSGKACIHGVGNGEKDLFIDEKSRTGHMSVFGTNGSGKTTFQRFLLRQDARAKAAIIVFDPKKNKELLDTVKNVANQAGKQLFMFDLSDPEESACYNPLGFYARVTEVANRVTSGLPDDGGDSAAFAQYAWLFSNLDAQALVAMGEVVTLEAIRHYLPRPDKLLLDLWYRLVDEDMPEKPKGFKPQGWIDDAAIIAAYLQKHPSPHSIVNQVAELLAYPREYYSKISNALLPQLDKLLTGPTGKLFLPSPDREMFSWREIIENQDVVYVSLISLADPVVGSSVARMMFADLASEAGRMLAQDTTLKVYAHADELGDLLGDTFVPMVNKSRQAGFVITAYTQTLSDIVVEMGSYPKAYRITGNFNSTIMLRVVDAETSQSLIEKLPEIKVSSGTQVNLAVQSSDPNSDSDFVSHAGDRLASERIPMISPAILASLPDGHGFAMIKGGDLIKFRFPELVAA